VFGKLERGEVHLYPLVIPEGYTRWDIAAEIERLGWGRPRTSARHRESASH
jgi:hypothetical protein